MSKENPETIFQNVSSNGGSSSTSSINPLVKQELLQKVLLSKQHKLQHLQEQSNEPSSSRADDDYSEEMKENDDGSFVLTPDYIQQSEFFFEI